MFAQEKAVYQELCDKENEVIVIENKVAALAASIDEVLEHYHSELQKADDKYELTLLNEKPVTTPPLIASPSKKKEFDPLKMEQGIKSLQETALAISRQERKRSHQVDSSQIVLPASKTSNSISRFDDNKLVVIEDSTYEDRRYKASSFQAKDNTK